MIVNSGLVAVDGVECPSDFTNLAVLPPFCKFWDSFSRLEKEKLVRNFLSVYIHNMLNTDDFPTGEYIKGQLDRLEKSIQGLSNNEWCKLLLDYGNSGKMLSRRCILDLPPHMHASLAGDRAEWESLVSPALDNIAEWLDNNKLVEAWHVERLSRF